MENINTEIKLQIIIHIQSSGNFNFASGLCSTRQKNAAEKRYTINKTL